jgi:outer membrane biosynthesis protein TonB
MPEFQTFRVKLYSPSPQVQGPPAPAPVVTQNIVQTPIVDRPVETTRPETAIERPEQTRVEEVKQEEAAPVAGDRPDPNSTGGEDIDVDIGDEEFPFPEYLENIVLQMGRFIRWSGDSDPEAVVAFSIARDGSVGNLRVVEKSIDWRFDLQALDAVTQAGRAGAFGPLPDGWVQDRLWVKFRFIPPGR